MSDEKKKKVEIRELEHIRTGGGISTVFVADVKDDSANDAWKLVEDLRERGIYITIQVNSDRYAILDDCGDVIEERETISDAIRSAHKILTSK